MSGWGVLARPQLTDAGFTLGYRHATYIYPRIHGDAHLTGQSTYWGWAPIRTELPFFLSTRAAGLEFQTVAGQSMLHVGFVDHSLTFLSPAEESRTGSFSYARLRPEETYLIVNKHAQPNESIATINP